MKTTIKNIADFYQAHPECLGKLTTKTRHGTKRIECAAITAYDSEVIKLVTDTGRTIEGSPDHMLYSNDWIKIKDISVGSYLETIEGKELVSFVEKQDYLEDLYDLQIEEVKSSMLMAL